MAPPRAPARARDRSLYGWLRERSFCCWFPPAPARDDGEWMEPILREPTPSHAEPLPCAAGAGHDEDDGSDPGGSEAFREDSKDGGLPRTSDGVRSKRREGHGIEERPECTEPSREPSEGNGARLEPNTSSSDLSKPGKRHSFEERSEGTDILQESSESNNTQSAASDTDSIEESPATELARECHTSTMLLLDRVRQRLADAQEGVGDKDAGTSSAIDEAMSQLDETLPESLRSEEPSLATSEDSSLRSAEHAAGAPSARGPGRSRAAAFLRIDRAKQKLAEVQENAVEEAVEEAAEEAVEEPVEEAIEEEVLPDDDAATLAQKYRSQTILMLDRVRQRLANVREDSVGEEAGVSSPSGWATSGPGESEGIRQIPQSIDFPRESSSDGLEEASA